MTWNDLSADAMALLYGYDAVERECRACDAEPLNRQRHERVDAIHSGGHPTTAIMVNARSGQPFSHAATDSSAS
jgi:hypothetical protein